MWMNRFIVSNGLEDISLWCVDCGWRQVDYSANKPSIFSSARMFACPGRLVVVEESVLPARYGKATGKRCCLLNGPAHAAPVE